MTQAFALRLVEMRAELAQASSVYEPSALWQELSGFGTRQLEAFGFEHFKRTLNMRYFNWDVRGILAHQWLPVFRRWCWRPSWTAFRSTFSDYGTAQPGVASFNPISAAIYRVYVAMLWDVVARQDHLGLLAHLEEPHTGKPFLIHHRGRWISQDLCNSVHEFYSAGGTDGVNRRWAVAELGAGYGRLAYVFLKALPDCSYTIIDIPPALQIAEQYLNEVFPDERIFRFRRFARFEDVRDEFEASRIRLLAAPQIERLPDELFDMFLNISSLHEMTMPQIVHYLRHADRLCRGRFYTKQWRVSHAKINGCVLKEHDYPLPQTWTTLYHRRHPIQRWFFEALYRTRPAAEIS